MKPQKITVKIPRKQGEMIPFNLELWNTGEYEAIDKNYGLSRILCTDNKGNYPIVVCNSEGLVTTYRSDGKYIESEFNSRLFLRKKTSAELIDNMYLNLYNRGVSVYYSEEGANEASQSDRIALLHITYEWEDEK